MKIKKFDKIEVLWMDSNHDSGWTKESYYKNNEDFLEHFSCGYFLNYTKRAINIVQSKSEFTDKNKERNVDAMMQIPKRAVIKIRKLR